VRGVAISSVEAAIRKILEAASWSHNPIRFLVLDFSMVPGTSSSPLPSSFNDMSIVGVDFSAAEAFVRIQRLLEDKGVVLVLCGCSSESPVGLALRSVDLWAGGSEEGSVEVFANQNDALEVSPFLSTLWMER
jgi:SulP family sulfate permease